MNVAYTIYEERLTAESVEAGEAESTEAVEAGCDSLKNTLRRASREYGIVSNGEHDTTNWWGSNHPREDREYFEDGVEKFYTLHLHCALSPRNMRRINRMLEAAR